MGVGTSWARAGGIARPSRSIEPLRFATVGAGPVESRVSVDK